MPTFTIELDEIRAAQLTTLAQQAGITVDKYIIDSLPRPSQPRSNSFEFSGTVLSHGLGFFGHIHVAFDNYGYGFIPGSSIDVNDDWMRKWFIPGARVRGAALKRTADALITELWTAERGAYPRLATHTNILNETMRYLLWKSRSSNVRRRALADAQQRLTEQAVWT